MRLEVAATVVVVEVVGEPPEEAVVVVPFLGLVLLPDEVIGAVAQVVVDVSAVALIVSPKLAVLVGGGGDAVAAAVEELAELIGHVNLVIPPPAAGPAVPPQLSEGVEHDGHYGEEDLGVAVGVGLHRRLAGVPGDVGLLEFLGERYESLLDCQQQEQIARLAVGLRVERVQLPLQGTQLSHNRVVEVSDRLDVLHQGVEGLHQRRHCGQVGRELVGGRLLALPLWKRLVDPGNCVVVVASLRRLQLPNLLVGHQGSGEYPPEHVRLPEQLGEEGTCGVAESLRHLGERGTVLREVIFLNVLDKVILHLGHKALVPYRQVGGDLLRQPLQRVGHPGGEVFQGVLRGRHVVPAGLLGELRDCLFNLTVYEAFNVFYFLPFYVIGVGEELVARLDGLVEVTGAEGVNLCLDFCEVFVDVIFFEKPQLPVDTAGFARNLGAQFTEMFVDLGDCVPIELFNVFLNFFKTFIFAFSNFLFQMF
ncbi:hypothetical protein BOVATA_047690 [Babesia ovata]|uniref:Uncharacterized protein n=1 Tax=Babesia ovata TaxID=189622 RepID=A0A2H6KJV9_9APIC|nr:uncharacterized protein BOVATA_047690 [Babesia ovata]GBE63276.1 hypothetical protein BOVATA_047690 [Babesia ovata]